MGVAVEDIVGDRSLRDGEIDRLGFTEVAERIAVSIVDRASADGMVIGLNGEWGSGKSSLLHLIERSLEQLPDNVRPSIIHFRPWLVGNRDALLTSLFSELASKILLVESASGTRRHITKKKVTKTARALLRFANGVSKAGQLIELAGGWWSPFSLIGKALGALGIIVAQKDETSDLSYLKSQIMADLRELNHRFIVTIDDVDRLEPREVIEILRLVRSVADFPNIIYILCYDANRLAEAIEVGANIKNGNTYLEKIIQLTIMVPLPESFELRTWFTDSLNNLLGPVDSDVAARLQDVIDREGDLALQTPRSVVRVLDSIRFLWPATKDARIDAADLVWLQLVKDSCPELYRWIETYLADASATSFGTAHIPESEKSEHLAAMLKAGERRFKNQNYCYFFSNLLPGIVVSTTDNDTINILVHEKPARQDRVNAIKNLRLASPDHYKLYFSLNGPSYAISQEQFDEFWSATESSPQHVATAILKLHSQSALGRLRKSDVLFERLHTIVRTDWLPLRAKNLLLALGEAMDHIEEPLHRRRAFHRTIGDRAEQLVFTLYRSISAIDRQDVLQNFFQNGQSIGWISVIIRRETFAHGLFGSRPKHPDEWIFESSEFSQICSIMLKRYQNMSFYDLSNTPNPVEVLFAWQQLGDESGPRDLVGKAIIMDEEFLRTLGMLTGIASGHNGNYATLRAETVSAFMDFDAAYARLKAIAKHGQVELREQAAALVRAAEDGNNF